MHHNRAVNAGQKHLGIGGIFSDDALCMSATMLADMGNRRLVIFHHFHGNNRRQKFTAKISV